MKKLLLLLLCVPLIGLGQVECNTEEEVSILIQIGICIDDYDENYDGYLYPCLEDCYEVKKIQEKFILIFYSGNPGPSNLNCGSTGCDIYLFEKIQNNYELVFSFYGYVYDDNINSQTEEIQIIEKDYWDGGDEGYWEEEEFTYYKLTIRNNIAKAKRTNKVRYKDGDFFSERCWDERGEEIECE